MDRRGSTCPSITKSFEGANYLSMMALTLSRSCLLIPSPAANWNTLFLFSLGFDFSKKKNLKNRSLELSRCHLSNRPRSSR